jgi:transposase-like protein
VSYETARRWFLKFGPAIAASLRRLRPRPSDYWHPNVMVVRMNGKKYWLWRAVDKEGEELGFLVQMRRNAKGAKKLMKKLLKKHGFTPTRVVDRQAPFLSSCIPNYRSHCPARSRSSRQ